MKFPLIVEGSNWESMEHREKVWGTELWLVNNKEYCGKLLALKKGCVCSYHYHPTKKETFYVLMGKIKLTVNDIDYIMANKYLEVKGSSPRTINPGVKHKFEGLTNALILEISTHHEDSDCVRLTESKGA